VPVLTNERSDDPIRHFADLLVRARAAGSGDATAHVLATCAGGVLSARYVLLKGADARGFVFYTNLGSRKAADLAENARAALCFHWPGIGTEVRVEGSVVPVSSEEADAYFRTRPRRSQIGAWASKQSARLRNRLLLLERAGVYAFRFLGRSVPRPPWWSGFRVQAHAIEFVEEVRPGLAEHTAYVLEDGAWTRATR
jgi:pyridoxamine 5'-phosphate oxidase